MPVFGTLDVTPLLEAAPHMPSLHAEPWEIQRAEILQLMFEIDEANMTSLLPRALHPTIPPVVMFTVARYPDSPVGPFMLAQVRIGCRAAVRPRGFLLQAYVDQQPAAGALAANWGYGCKLGEVRLQRFHDRITASVLAGTEILRMSLVNPEPISGGDVQYVASMHLARLTGDGDKPALVQVDPEFRFHTAERGRPELTQFEGSAWRADGVRPVYPVHASFAVCDTNFPKLRYVMDPEVPAMQGTRAVS